jgi:hypothetical protein
MAVDDGLIRVPVELVNTLVRRFAIPPEVGAAALIMWLVRGSKSFKEVQRSRPHHNSFVNDYFRVQEVQSTSCLASSFRGEETTPERSGWYKRATLAADFTEQRATSRQQLGKRRRTETNCAE